MANHGGQTRVVRCFGCAYLPPSIRHNPSRLHWKIRPGGGLRSRTLLAKCARPSWPSSSLLALMTPVLRPVAISTRQARTSRPACCWLRLWITGPLPTCTRGWLVPPMTRRWGLGKLGFRLTSDPAADVIEAPAKRRGGVPGAARLIHGRIPTLNSLQSKSAVLALPSSDTCQNLAGGMRLHAGSSAC